MLSVTNCVFPCHFKTDITDMTWSNSDFVTDDQFPILRVQTFQRSVSVVVWLEPLETENIGATLSSHPGQPGRPGPPHTSIMVIIISTETRLGHCPASIEGGNIETFSNMYFMWRHRLAMVIPVIP